MAGSTPAAPSKLQTFGTRQKALEKRGFKDATVRALSFASTASAEALMKTIGDMSRRSSSTPLVQPAHGANSPASDSSAISADIVASGDDDTINIGAEAPDGDEAKGLTRLDADLLVRHTRRRKGARVAWYQSDLRAQFVTV